MGISDRIFLFGTLFPDKVRKFWPSRGRFPLTSKRNPQCVHTASLCIVGVVAILNITISSTGDNYTTKSALTSFFVDCSTSFMYRSNPNFSLATGTSAISLSTRWYRCQTFCPGEHSQPPLPDAPWSL